MLIVLVASLHAGAASLAEPRAVALGGAYTTLAAGPEALHWNPANLRANPVSFEMSFPLTAGLGVDNTYFSLNRLLLDPKVYDSGEAFLADIAGGKLEGGGSGAVQAGISIGRFAFAARGEANIRMTLNPDGTRLFAVGPEPGTTYTFDGTGADALAAISVGGGFAFDVTPARLTDRYEGALLAVGTTVKRYSGLFFSESELSGTIKVANDSSYEADLRMVDLTTDLEGGLLSGPTGDGYGVDIGVALRPNPKLTVGASLRNVLSSMTWRGLIESEVTVSGKLLEADSGGPKLPSDPNDFTSIDATIVPVVERRLPMDFRAGMSYRVSPKLLIATDVAKTLAGSGADRPMSLHFGVELLPFAKSDAARRPAFRVGFEQSGGQSFFSYGVGFGLWKWELEAAVRLPGGLAPVDAQGAALSAAARLRW